MTRPGAPPTTAAVAGEVWSLSFEPGRPRSLLALALGVGDATEPTTAWLRPDALTADGRPVTLAELLAWLAGRAARVTLRPFRGGRAYHTAADFETSP